MIFTNLKNEKRQKAKDNGDSTACSVGRGMVWKKNIVKMKG